MTDEEYEKTQKKIKADRIELLNEIQQKLPGINVDYFEQRARKALSESNAIKRPISHLGNELREKMNALLKARDRIISGPELSVDEMYEQVFKDFCTKEQYQNLTKETYEEMLKMGHYRPKDSKKKH